MRTLLERETSIKVTFIGQRVPMPDLIHNAIEFNMRGEMNTYGVLVG